MRSHRPPYLFPSQPTSTRISPLPLTPPCQEAARYLILSKVAHPLLLTLPMNVLWLLPANGCSPCMATSHLEWLPLSKRNATIHRKLCTTRTWLSTMGNITANKAKRIVNLRLPAELQNSIIKHSVQVPAILQPDPWADPHLIVPPLLH